MIHEIGVELQAALHARGAPFNVYDGPEKRPTTTGARERIVIEHDPNGDSFEPRHRADGRVPARTYFSRDVGVKLTIYAQEVHKGAIYWEHKRRAEKLLDFVLVGLYKVVTARQNILKLKSGKFVEPEDLDKSETPGSATYELFFTVDRGVADRNWDGTLDKTTMISAVAPQTSPTGVVIANSGTVSQPGQADEPLP